MTPISFVLPLLLAGTLLLGSCAERRAAFVEVGKTYTFFLEHDIKSNWVRGRVQERTADGWFRVKFEGQERWINADRVLFIQEKN